MFEKDSTFRKHAGVIASLTLPVLIGIPAAIYIQKSHERMINSVRNESIEQFGVQGTVKSVTAKGKGQEVVIGFSDGSTQTIYTTKNPSVGEVWTVNVTTTTTHSLGEKVENE